MGADKLLEATRMRKSCTIGAAVWFAAVLSTVALAAQNQGPLPPPTARASSAVTPSASMPKTAAPPQNASSHISNEPPPMPVEQLIQQFAEHETEFKKERDNFTYTQTFAIQTIDDDGQPDGEYRLTSDILFTPAGKRYEKVTYAPPSTLQRIILTQQDFDDLVHVQPFVLTTEMVPKYDVKYLGREQVDELNTYVFEVAPKAIEKNQRYFQGRIWVDDKDLQIVRNFGKAVPQTITKKGGNEAAYPSFETFRENIEGHYWFPTYTRADDNLHFSSGDVHIRMTVRYAKYKRFGVTIKIGAPIQVEPQHP
jgi:hypothetical protein